MNNKRLYLIYGCILTLAIFIFLFIVKIFCPTLLDIDTKWLIIACLPILIALIVGEYIKKFSGFGVDIEMTAKEPLMHNPRVIEALHTTLALEKREIERLGDIPTNMRSSYDVLVFRISRVEYYEPYAVQKYLENLPEIKFFELVDMDNKFLSLTKINRNEIFDNISIIEDFLRYLDRVSIGEIPKDTTTEAVYRDETIIKTLQTIRLSKKDFIAVIDEKKNLIGVVYEHKLEKCLANVVLRNLVGKTN